MTYPNATDTATYTLCNGCTTGICNDDWTFLDFNTPERAELLANRTSDFVKRAGWLTHLESVVESDETECACCEEPLDLDPDNTGAGAALFSAGLA